LARRPVEARRTGAFVHLLRWMQREKAAAAVLVLTLLLLVGAPLAYAWFQHRARVDLESANRRTDDQRARAERLYRQALATIDRLIEPPRRQGAHAHAQGPPPTNHIPHP